MIDDDQMPEADDGEFVPFDDTDVSSVRDTEDGGAIVDLGDEEGTEGSGEFLANLAETLPEHVLSRLATGLLDLIEKDTEARKKRDQQYEEGIKRTGLGDEAPGGAQFTGASKVVHPMLTEACVDFAARAIKELFPAGGPVKTSIIADPTPELEAKAKRKAALMNWQLTIQCKETRAELEQLLTQLPLGGAQYLKVRWDERRNRPLFEFVAIDDMLLPFAATNFYSSPRKTHRQYLTRFEYRKRVQSGMYRDVDLVESGMEPEETGAGKASDRIEGREKTSYNEDGLRTVYETQVFVAIEGAEDNGDPERDGNEAEELPYLVTIDKATHKVLSIYRNWDESDENREELLWAVEFPFIPWRGAYPIGLPHMIGGLSGAATGALRALLDSAHINNIASMIKLKGATGGQTLDLQPGTVTEIEAALNVDDIRKVAMPIPFNPPSVVLFQLLGFLVDAGKGVVRTALDDIADQNPNAPVGTTLAHMEQGMVVYSAIHGRLHDAMGRLLDILHRLNAMYLDDANIKAEIGEELATKEDFEGPMDVVPVSDPNIFSEAQRFAQVQAVAGRAQLNPDLYDRRKVEQRLLETLKIPDAEDLLVAANTPTEDHPVNENVAASLGRPIVAFPEQNHIAHLKSHIAFALSPTFGQNPAIMPKFAAVMAQHLVEHIVLWYAQITVEKAEEVSGVDFDEAIKDHKNKNTRRTFDALLSEVSVQAVDAATEALQQAEQVLAQLMQQAQQFAQQQPQPVDPGQAMMAETQRKTQADQLKAANDQAQLQQQAQATQVKAQIEQARLAQQGQLAQQHEQEEDQRVAMREAASTQRNTADNQTALTIAAAEIQSDDKIGLETGTGLNPGV